MGNVFYVEGQSLWNKNCSAQTLVEIIETNGARFVQNIPFPIIEKTRLLGTIPFPIIKTNGWQIYEKYTIPYYWKKTDGRFLRNIGPNY